MKKNNSSSGNVLYILNITVRLVVICAVIALLVATVNYFAAPVIEENGRIATENAIAKIFNREKIVYSEVTDAEIPESEAAAVDAVYSVSDTEGGFLGYGVKLCPTGFKGKVDLITAFDSEGFIIGVEITSTNDETGGIGTKVNSPSFTEQFLETAGSEISETPDKYIISGATRTSKPVTQSIITAKKIVSKLIGSVQTDSASGNNPEIKAPGDPPENSDGANSVNGDSTETETAADTNETEGQSNEQ